jgi:hypothetical protein
MYRVGSIVCYKLSFEDIAVDIADFFIVFHRVHSYGHIFNKKREISRTFAMKSVGYLALFARDNTSCFWESREHFVLEAKAVQ